MISIVSKAAAFLYRLTYLNMRHGKNSFLQESGEELTPGYELHDEVELLLRLEGVGQAHEEGVPQVGHDESLWGQSYKAFYGRNLRIFVIS
jgi:hypothetical protein